MTFLTTRYHLKQNLTPKDFERLHSLSTVYGIRGLFIEGQLLELEYDASRIHEAEVLAQVRRAGIAVEPVKPIAPGSFDCTGEFRDFAWPTQGLSPANQKG
ncbi:MAG: hypothetical protein WB763_01135 [Terriglobia bacterium]|jgi:hypothetical protein